MDLGDRSRVQGWMSPPTVVRVGSCRGVDALPSRAWRSGTMALTRRYRGRNALLSGCPHGTLPLRPC